LQLGPISEKGPTMIQPKREVRSAEGLIPNLGLRDKGGAKGAMGKYAGNRGGGKLRTEERSQRFWRAS